VQGDRARSAPDRFGRRNSRNDHRRRPEERGRHVAGLNLGDCISYALAKTAGEPLLFKGADFAKTDIAVAIAPA